MGNSQLIRSMISYKVIDYMEVSYGCYAYKFSI